MRSTIRGVLALGSLAGLLTAAVTFFPSAPSAEGGPATRVDDYALFASDLLRTRGALSVDGLAVGVNRGSLLTRGPLDANDQDVVVGGSNGLVRLRSGSGCSTLFAFPAKVIDTNCSSSPVMSFVGPIVDDVPAACGFPVSFPACGGSDVTVGHDQSLTLAGGTPSNPTRRGKVLLRGAGPGASSLTLTGGTYVFCSLRVGRHSSLFIGSAAQVFVAGDVQLFPDSIVGPTNPAASKALAAFVNGERVRISRRARFTGRVCAPNALLALGAKSQVFGTLVARVISADRNATVQGIAVTPATTTSTLPPTTTSTILPATTTSTLPPTTTSTILPTTTTTTLPSGPNTFKITIRPGTTSCGGVGFGPPAAAPISGELRDSTNTKIANSGLGTGCLYFGGGSNLSVPGGAIPTGSDTYFAVTGRNGTVLTLGPSSGTGPGSCSRVMGPSMACVDPQHYGTPCTTDVDCGAALSKFCQPVANCYFGPPLPIPNPPNPALSTCVVNVFGATAVGGTVDTAANGATSMSVPLSSRVYLTGNVTAPCPVCSGATGVCSRGPNANKPCKAVGAGLTSIDCPSDGVFQAPLPITFAPLTTGQAVLTETIVGAGRMCPGQAPSKKGAFGIATAASVVETGKPSAAAIPASPGSTRIEVGSAFCIPTVSATIDPVAGLPGPGALSLILDVSTTNLP